MCVVLYAGDLKLGQQDASTKPMTVLVYQGPPSFVRSVD